MSQVNGFDISNLDNLATDNSHRVPVLFDENGDDKSGFIIVGKNSSQFQAESRALRQESLMRGSRRKTAPDASTPEGAKSLSELIATNERRLATSVVVGWFGFVANGEEVAFDAKVAQALLTKYPTWVEKINNALDVDSNFMKG